MTLYGPLTARDYLRRLQDLAGRVPDRRWYADVLEAIVDTLEAERGFLVKLHASGNVKVLVSRDFDGRSVKQPQECISLFGLQRAMDSETDTHMAEDCAVDRRYRTEAVRRGRRPARSILVLRVASGQEGSAVFVYLDHRFQALRLDEHGKTSVAHWLALLELAQRMEADRRKIDALERAARRARRGSGGRPAETDSAVEQAPPRPVAPREFHGLWTCSLAMVELFASAERIAMSELPVVILGETGTGKGLIASAVHACSPRSASPFVSVNCGSIPDALLESELFGHIRGSFTGAERDRVGMLVEADGGTLFLDEISDMSSAMQKKLLRFLENGRFRPLGAKEEMQADVRLLSATRADLEAAVADGRLRSDLFYRLCGVRLNVLPLRERREDIIGLAERFLERHCAELGRGAGAESGREPPIIDESARRWLLRYSWPGNVRELENLMCQLSTASEDRVREQDLASNVWRGVDHFGGSASRLGTMDEVVQRAERNAVLDALGRSAWNKSRAAELLGITRKALYRRLTKFGLVDDPGLTPSEDDVSSQSDFPQRDEGREV